MAGKIGVGAVDHRLVEARTGDARLEIIADSLPGRTAKKTKMREHVMKSSPASFG
jgi:hypothetical protein